MTSLPTWLVFLIAPLLSLLGALIGTAVVRIGARELNHREQRQEALRMLRWAADLAVSVEMRRARVGLAMLRALASVVTESDHRRFIDAAIYAMFAKPEHEVLLPDYDTKDVHERGSMHG